METTTKPNPLRGINIDSPHYAGMTPLHVWHVVLDGFAARRNQPTPTAEEMRGRFERGESPNEAWAAIAAARKANA